MITDKPVATPVTVPAVGSTVAIVVVPLLQLPPVAASVSSVVMPAHTRGLPAISAGNGFTVRVAVAKQPWLSV